jgi:hypothetical protein
MQLHTKDNIKTMPTLSLPMLQQQLGCAFGFRNMRIKMAVVLLLVLVLLLLLLLLLRLALFRTLWGSGTAPAPATAAAASPPLRHGTIGHSGSGICSSNTTHAKTSSTSEQRCVQLFINERHVCNAGFPTAGPASLQRMMHHQ